MRASHSSNSAIVAQPVVALLVGEDGRSASPCVGSVYAFVFSLYCTESIAKVARIKLGLAVAWFAVSLDTRNAQTGQQVGSKGLLATKRRLYWAGRYIRCCVGRLP